MGRPQQAISDQRLATGAIYLDRCRRQLNNRGTGVVASLAFQWPPGAPTYLQVYRVACGTEEDEPEQWGIRYYSPDGAGTVRVCLGTFPELGDALDAFERKAGTLRGFDPVEVYAEAILPPHDLEVLR